MSFLGPASHFRAFVRISQNVELFVLSFFEGVRNMLQKEVGGILFFWSAFGLG